eukprot:TRINITY_DN9092_c0_g1_i2.p1 TRINITY_DN9092_c0_g1~~TRINITY_DN9092_c0_g1_i2.p1  ORF type:complete len:405 (+),score=78.25 TRINITY_DN9092_c0_g1_i2:62-1276(+)
MLRLLRNAACVSARCMSIQAQSARSTPTCLPKFASVLEQVDNEVLLSLDEIRSQNSHALWIEGVDTLKRIAAAPTRHLLSSQLLLLSHVHDLPVEKLDDNVANDVIMAAAAAELLHLFMLVQDDVMDNSLVRRGSPTVHHHLRGRLLTSTNHSQSNRLANSYATVISDCVHVAANDAMALTCSSDALSAFHDMAMMAAQYQFEDLTGWLPYRSDPEHIEQAVERVMRLLAHARFTSPMLVGQCFSAEPLPDAALAWASAFGNAFKLLSDVSDVAAGALNSGKDPLRNLHEGRPSAMVPAIFSGDYAPQAEDMLSAAVLSGANTPSLELLGALLLPHQAAERVLARVDCELRTAKMALDQLPRGQCLHEGLTNFTAGLQAHCDTLAERVQAEGKEVRDMLTEMGK